MYLYNTLTRKKQEFKPIEEGKVKMYTCGPTVYNFAHIGNLRSYIFSDILRRALEYNSYKVNQVVNITDVGHLTSDADEGEDKLEKGAKREGKTAWEVAEFYEKSFKEDISKLNIKEPTIWAKATEHINEQIEFIKALEEKGFTYKTSDGIYFDSSKLKEYPELAKLDIEGLEAGARIDMREKKNITDFALWKFSPQDKKRQMEWESPWGKGFPGWHIECSAMSTKYLGEKIDIHSGGIDHVPVHHTNERVQNIAYFGEAVVNFWIHGEHLLVKEEKMAKSEGNFITLQTIIEKGFSPLEYRYFCLKSHYRSVLNFDWQLLDKAKDEFKKLKEKIIQWEETSSINEDYKKEFLTAINDDLNMPEAWAVVWKLIKDKELSDADKKATMLDFDQVLGLGLADITKEELVIPEEVKELAQKRQEARKNKKWEESDSLRKEIEKLGFNIEDTKEGYKLSKK